MRGSDTENMEVCLGDEVNTLSTRWNWRNVVVDFGGNRRREGDFEKWVDET